MRGIVWVKARPDGFEVLCDCATLTHVILHLELPVRPLAPGERMGVPGDQIAFTCDGCNTTHWLDFKAVIEGS